MRVIPMAVGPTAVSGVIGTDTAIGGGDFTVPVWAKSIMGVSLGITQDVAVTAQAVLARANLVSNNCPIQPFHALAAPILASLGASAESPSVGKIEKYDMNLRVNGGEAITPNMRTVTTATLPYGTMLFLISDATPTETQKHVQCGTATLDAVTNNTENNGTAYSLSGARNIVELIGVESQITPAIAEGYISRIRYQSAEFAGVNTVDLLMNPVVGAIAATMSGQSPGVARQKCNVPIQPVSQCNIQDSHRFLSSANLGASITFLSGVVYEV